MTPREQKWWLALYALVIVVTVLIATGVLWPN